MRPLISSVVRHIFFDFHPFSHFDLGAPGLAAIGAAFDRNSTDSAFVPVRLEQKHSAVHSHYHAAVNHLFVPRLEKRLGPAVRIERVSAVKDLKAVRQSVIIGIPVQRIGPELYDLFPVVHAVAVRVGFERIGFEFVDFRAVGQAIIIAVDVVRGGLEIVFPQIAQPVPVVICVRIAGLCGVEKSVPFLEAIEHPVAVGVLWDDGFDERAFQAVLLLQVPANRVELIQGRIGASIVGQDAVVDQYLGDLPAEIPF